MFKCKINICLKFSREGAVYKIICASGIWNPSFSISLDYKHAVISQKIKINYKKSKTSFSHILSSGYSLFYLLFTMVLKISLLVIIIYSTLNSSFVYIPAASYLSLREKNPIDISLEIALIFYLSILMIFSSRWISQSSTKLFKART